MSAPDNRSFVDVNKPCSLNANGRPWIKEYLHRCAVFCSVLRRQKHSYCLSVAEEWLCLYQRQIYTDVNRLVLGLYFATFLCKNLLFLLIFLRFVTLF